MNFCSIFSISENYNLFPRVLNGDILRSFHILRHHFWRGRGQKSENEDDKFLMMTEVDWPLENQRFGGGRGVRHLKMITAIFPWWRRGKGSADFWWWRNIWKLPYPSKLKKHLPGWQSEEESRAPKIYTIAMTFEEVGIQTSFRNLQGPRKNFI